MKLMMTRLLVLAVALAQVSCATGGGKTLTRGELRSLVEESVLWLDGDLAPECKSREIVDSEILQFSPDGTWSERWTVNRCGKPIKYKLKFNRPQPDGKGKFDVNFHAKMED